MLREGLIGSVLKITNSFVLYVLEKMTNMQDPLKIAMMSN